MAKRLVKLEFVETVTHIHDFEIEVDESVDLDDVISEIEDNCTDFSDIRWELESVDGIEVMDWTEGEYNGDTEVECTDEDILEYIEDEEDEE